MAFFEESLSFLDVQKAQVAARRSHNRFLSIFGEIFGIQQMRQRFGSLPQILLVDDLLLRAHNPKTRRPDGLAYEVVGADLILHGILESKIGTASFSLVQFLGFLQSLKTTGIGLPSGNFIPENIWIQTSHGRVSAQTVTIQELVSICLLVQTREVFPRQSSDTQPPDRRQHPLTIDEMEQIHSEYLLRRLKIEDSEFLEYMVAKRRLARIKPMVDTLNQWIADPLHLRFPQDGSTDELESKLGRWINHNGGQKGVFRNFLTPANRLLPELRYNVDPVELLNDWIADPAHQRFPKSGSSDWLEKKLGAWIYTNGGQEAVFHKFLTEANRSLPGIRWIIEPKVFLIRPPVDAANQKIPRTNHDDAVAQRLAQLFGDSYLELALDNSQVLNDWIAHPTHKRFPNAQSIDALESRLGNWISTHGGQEGVFNSILTTANRLLPDIRINVEPVVLLNEWIADPAHQRFPKDRSSDALEARLGKWINHNGGQAAVFYTFLTTENRAFPELRFNIEPAKLLNDWIADPAHQRFPNANSSNLLERKLGFWVANNGGQDGIFENVLSPPNRLLQAIAVSAGRAIARRMKKCSGALVPGE